jgi:hypothetical protein
MSDTDLKDFCHEQFIRIHINKEYKRVDLKEVISRIEKLNPLTLDVIDNTIIDVDASIEEQEKEDSKTKEFEDYAEDYIKGDKNLYAMFKDIEQEARDKMKEIE